MSEEPKKETRTFSEQMDVLGGELIERVEELIKQGNVRRLIIRRPSGEVLLEVPLTASVVVGVPFTILAPVWVALGALAGALARFTIEIVRVSDEKQEED